MLTDSQFQTVLAALRSGAPVRVALSAVGVRPAEWARWVREVRAGRAPDPLADQVREIQAVEAQTEVALLGLVQRRALQDWRAAAWLLEHRGGEPRARAELRRLRAQLRAGGLGPPPEVVLQWPE